VSERRDQGCTVMAQSVMVAKFGASNVKKLPADLHLANKADGILKLYTITAAWFALG
jgi:hypothetical protein